MAKFFEELPINGAGSTHHLSHDKSYLIHELVSNSKRQVGFTSGGIINSMMESIEDMHENAKLFKYPLMVFIAGNDKIIKNS